MKKIHTEKSLETPTTKVRNLYTEPLIRSWLRIRVDAFLPRIQKVRWLAKTHNYRFTLQELAADMRRTLTEFEERIEKGSV